MAREDWKTINVREELVLLSEKAAIQFGYPNATQYVNEAVRERLRRDGLLSPNGDSDAQ